MSDRETKTLTTTGGHVVVYNAYLTGGESDDLRSELLKGVEISADAAQTGEKPKVPLANTIAYQARQIEALIVSLDGSTDGAYTAFRNLPSVEYDAAVVEMKKEAGLSLTQAK